MGEANAYAIFLRQLAVILRANVSPLTALKISCEQVENRRLKKKIKQLVEDMSNGDRISDAMKKQSDKFPMVMISAFECAEKSGNWEEIMVRLARLFEMEANLLSNAKRATLIPLGMVIVCMAALGVVVLEVIPGFAELFTGIDYTFTGLTETVIKVSTFVREYSGYILLLIGGLVFLWLLFSLTRLGRSANGRISMMLPLSGKVNTGRLYAYFCQLLSTLLKNGSPIEQAIRVVEDSIGINECVRNELAKAGERVSAGMSLSKALSDSSVFSNMILQMTSIGEESGNLTKILDDMADYYERRTIGDAHQKTVILESVAVVITGIIMCIVIISMVHPMLDFYEMVSTM